MVQVPRRVRYSRGGGGGGPAGGLSDVLPCREVADVVSKAVRSRMMSRIRAKDTAPELTLRRALHRMGFRFRLHARDLPGCPDIVLPRHRLAIFVHGCFWHHHQGCRFAAVPSTRRAFWKAKFKANRERDRLARIQLTRLGWNTMVFWECELRPLVSRVRSAGKGKSQVRLR